MISLLAFLLAAALPAPNPPCAGGERVTRTAIVMGTALRIEVAGAERGCALAAAEAVLAEIERLDGVLSSWRPDAALARLNAAPEGVVAPIPAELEGYLTEAAHWAAATGGAFDPAVGALVNAWDLRGTGRVPDEPALAAARASSGLRNCFEIRPAVRLGSACWLDTGGFGKGVALRAAVRVLETRGVRDALLDFGGQVQVLAEPAEVAVAHPADRNRAAATLRLVRASVATTSQSERFIERDGVRYGHVLDPRSGRPVPAWGSVTVVAADALAADALSTALFVMGPEAALAWARVRRDVGVLVLRFHEGDVVATWNAALDPFLVSLSPTTKTSKETF